MAIKEESWQGGRLFPGRQIQVDMLSTERGRMEDGVRLWKVSSQCGRQKQKTRWKFVMFPLIPSVREIPGESKLLLFSILLNYSLQNIGLMLSNFVYIKFTLFFFCLMQTDANFALSHIPAFFMQAQTIWPSINKFSACT